MPIPVVAAHKVLGERPRHCKSFRRSSIICGDLMGRRADLLDSPAESIKAG
jgi:hypothetical protein